jgi:acyl-CoA synthetase (AMP-forming)/AMP-acid ligase II
VVLTIISRKQWKRLLDMTQNQPTLWQLFVTAAQRHPHNVMLIDAATATQMTYASAFETSERLAAALFERGVKFGTVVSWLQPTRVQTLLLTLALARLGATQNPVLHLYREREFSAVISQVKPAFVIVPPAVATFDYPQLAIDAIAASGQSPQLMVLADALPQGDIAALPPAPLDANSVHWIYCTSGTTSAPKGVVHTDASVIGGGSALSETTHPTPQDVGSIAIPLGHIGGAAYLVMMLLNGIPAVLIERFIPARAVEIFRRYSVTLAGGSTAHYQALLAEQRKQPQPPIAPSLRILSGGGASKPPQLFFDVKHEMNCTIVHAYGMTEAPFATSNDLMDSDDDLAYTDGIPVTGMQVRVVRSDGEPAQAGEEGEIRLRGVNVCKGYIDAEQTAAAFDELGFFRTGDLGVLSASGRISVTGRIKDIIIRKGENISAKEIEDLLYTHPKIAAVAIIGLPDTERGERVCAVVQLKDPANTLEFGEIVEFLAAHKLMRQKIPEQLEILDSLPRNEALNKIIKYQLRERFMDKR